MGFCVLNDHGAPHDDVSEAEHLTKEVSQARTGVDSLAVYESVDRAHCRSPSRVETLGICLV